MSIRKTFVVIRQSERSGAGSPENIMIAEPLYFTTLGRMNDYKNRLYFDPDVIAIAICNPYRVRFVNKTELLGSTPPFFQHVAQILYKNEIVFDFFKQKIVADVVIDEDLSLRNT